MAVAGSRRRAEYCLLGLDFGFHSPEAGAIIRIDTDNVWDLTDEYYRTGRTQEEIENDLRAVRNQIPFREVYPDSEDPARIESMKRAGFACRDVDKNVALGVSRVRELIKKRQFFVFNTCHNALDEFNSYRYDPEKPKEQPIKENDHLMDALRYAVYNHRSGTSVMPRPTTGLVKPLPGMAA